MTTENKSLMIAPVEPVDGAAWSEYQLLGHGDLGKFDISNPRHISLLQRYNVIPNSPGYSDPFSCKGCHV